METRKEFRWLVLGISMAVVLFCSGTVSAQFNIPDAVDEPITASDGSIWEQVSLPGFGDEANMSVVAMAEYQGSLYAMTRNNAGTEVWRTDDQGGWEQVLFPDNVTNGVYGNPWLNNVWARMIVFNGKLYFGFSSGLQGSYRGSTGCEIWRYDGTTWEAVISDERSTEVEGTITAISSCTAGDGLSTAVFTVSAYYPEEYTWENLTGGTLRILDGDGIYRRFDINSNSGNELRVQQDENAGVLNEDTVCSEQVYNNPFPAYSYTLGAIEVGDSCAISIGDNQNGFGQTWNKTITAMRIFDGKLYVSTGLNYKYGGQVWYTADGDTWQKTASVRDTVDPYTYHSFGNFHYDTKYPGDRKPVSTSISDLVVSSVSGTPVLYAGGTGSTGDSGGCARMARLTASGWELIVDTDVDADSTGSNENGFGSPESCTTNQYNFLPWSLADFNDELMVGISGAGARVIRAPYLFTEIYPPNLGGGEIEKDMSDDGRWFYSVGEGNVKDGYTDPLGTTLYPNGFDGYQYPGTTHYQNLAVNLFPFRTMLYGGTISQYIPEYGIPSDTSVILGAQLWKSPNGLTWTPITMDAFGDSDVLMFEAFADFGGTLYVAGSKGASSTPSSLGGAKIYRLAHEPRVNVTIDQTLADDFERYTVAGITTPLPELTAETCSAPQCTNTAYCRNTLGLTDYVCTRGVCKDPCTQDSDCAGGSYCNAMGYCIDCSPGYDCGSSGQCEVVGFLSASFLKAGDLDSDGKKEIIVSSTQGQSVNYWLKDGAVAVFKRTSEDLSTWTQTIIRDDFAFANDMLIRDVDGDGEVDIMVFDNFLAGAYTNYPAGIFMLRNLGGDVSDPANWEKVTIYEGDVVTTANGSYERAKARASYHQAYFLDLDGDGLEDFVTTRIAMEIWQAREATQPALYDQQYMWTEWFKAEEDPVTGLISFAGPYDIGDGAGFLMDMYDVDGDGLLDVLGPQFFITNPGSLVIKGPDDYRGDTLMWFKNPGPAALAADPNYEWESYTIDNWYTSTNPMSKGFMAFPADITNDGSNEIIVTSHNHQDYRPDSRPDADPPVYAQYRVWPSGVYYLSIPDDPYDAENWMPVSIDVGDAYAIDRPGGPYSQGSPGHAAVGDITGNLLSDLVVAGDGRGATYYYQAERADGGLNFRRAALYDDPASMTAEVKLYDIDDDGNLEILTTVYDTSVNKDSGSGSVFIFKRTAAGSCTDDYDCPEGYECVAGQCQLPVVDNPPVVGDGPFLAAGSWPRMPTTPESAFMLDVDYDVLWTFSDDFASCSEDCTHMAEYQALGSSEWTALAVTANAAAGTARVTLPVSSIQNATTYAFRFAVTDCASQTTESADTYYFRVATSDAPPVIIDGPFLAAGPWPVFPISASQAFVLDQNYGVYWTFSDDYASCSGLCTHLFRYRKVGDTAWSTLPVSTDAEGTSYAYVTLPVTSLESGTYEFRMNVRDCEGQWGNSGPKFFKFKVER
jgi:hypothetical protein